MKLLILIFSSVISLFYHAAGLSESHYYLEGDQIVLKFEMEENELHQYRIGMDCEKGTMSQWCNVNYVLSNSNLKINEQLVDFELETASVKSGHVVLVLKSIERFKEINQIDILSNCFYELNPEFKNRTRISINAIEKSFLLSKERNFVSIK